MARLPSGRYLMQQIDGSVILFEDHTEREIVKFDPADREAAERAQVVIDGSELPDEDKTFAHFWAGYFGYYAGFPAPEGGPVTYEESIELVSVFGENNRDPVVMFDPADQNATAQAQKVIYDSALSAEDKRRAYFWSGYLYARAA